MLQVLKSLLTGAFDTKLLSVTLNRILESKVVGIPKYDFKTHSRYLAE